MGNPERSPQRFKGGPKDIFTGLRGWHNVHFVAAEKIKADILKQNPTERLFDNQFEFLSTHTESELKFALYATAVAAGVVEKNARRKIRRALQVAEYAHKEQNRRFSDDSYKVHPMRSALIAMELAGSMGVKVTTELIVGAILHDTIEDNPEKIFPGFLNTVYKDMKDDYGKRIEADAEALSKYISLPDEAGRQKLEGEDYAKKIAIDPQTGAPVDNETLMRRIIIKTADRIDNLLDPPIYTENYVGKHNLTESRRKVISKTYDDVKPLLGTKPTETQYLSDIIDIALVLAQQSIDDPDFDPKNWREYALAA